MNNENQNKDTATINQMAWILNYQPQIKEQHIHIEGRPENGKTNTVADEEKRKALMAANIVIRTQKNSGQQTVDILKLYRFVDEYFVSEIKHKYEWYALRRFLERYSLLKNCDNEQFAAQMNSKEWFAHSKHSCEANEMNYYNYLNSLQPEQWLDKDVQLGSRATKRSVANIYRTHANLELYKDLLIG